MLADLTGVPDPLSHIGPFLRSILPFSGWQGHRLPPLKLWVKVVFALYILVTVPLLTVLTVYMVASAPRILATSWDSFLQHLASLTTAWNAGDALNVAATLLGMAVLALTVGGLAFFLYRLAAGGLRRLWSWGRQSAQRRVVAGVATVAAVGLVAWLWMPPLGAIGRQAGPLVANLRPIAEDDRLTVNDAVFAEGGLLGPTAGDSGTPSESTAPAAAPEPTPAPTPAPTPPPAPAATPAPTPTPLPVELPVPPVDAGEPVPELPPELPVDVDLDNPINDLGH
jgi:hypothetical protein